MGIQPDLFFVRKYWINFCVEPYGFDEASDFVIYTPGMQIASLPEEFVIWLSGVINVQDTSTLPCYGIYNVNGKMGFVQYE